MTGWGQSGPLALRAGHDINYISLTGVLDAIGPRSAPPTVPLNMIGDYGGGTMFLITGVLAALLSARTTGKGQVVDAAMVDSVAAMSAMIYGFRATGRWSLDREDNLLDGAAPFYRCYTCSDGRFVAVGALEPQFYRAFLKGLGLAADAYPQNDRSLWPAMHAHFARLFAAEPRDYWAAIFNESDACVTPVLDWCEAPHHPHNRARANFLTDGAFVQPAPAPRFSATPSAITAPETVTPEMVMDRWPAQEVA